MPIYTGELEYNILTLGFNKLLTKDSLLDALDEPITPELANSIVSAVSPKIILSGELAAEITNVSGYLQSSNFVSGSTGWKINADGEVEFGKGTFRGTLVIGTGSSGIASFSDAGDLVTVNETEIDQTNLVNAAAAGATVGGIFGTNISGGGSGNNQVGNDGYITTITDTAITVTNLAAINADLGSITAGNITIDSSGYIKGGQTGYNTGTGFFLGYDTDAYKLSIGNPAGEYLKWDGSNLIISGYAVSSKGTFGGDGSDGALSVSSGTTTIDCVNAKVVVKNYSSISITGTGKLAFSNPHASGTLIILKSQGNVTITSTTNPCIDVSAMGAAGGAIGSPLTNRGSGGGGGVFASNSCGGGSVGASVGHGGSSTGGTRVAISYPSTYYSDYLYAMRYSQAFIGAGGGAGESDVGNSAGCGAGGRGGGALIIECAKTLNFTGTISCSGAVGNNATTDAGGAGGGGGAGSVWIFYDSITGSSGSFTILGGVGGDYYGDTLSSCGGGGGGSFTAGEGKTTGDLGVGGDGGDGLGYKTQI